MINERTGAGGKTYGIGFAVALPDNWNNRFLFQGGGGYNGSVRPPVGGAAAGDNPGLARGFAVASTDTGHKGATFDTSYNVDQQASLDFAQVAVGRVTELAKQIVAQYYGQPATILLLCRMLDRRAGRHADDAALSQLFRRRRLRRSRHAHRLFADRKQLGRGRVQPDCSQRRRRKAAAQQSLFRERQKVDRQRNPQCLRRQRRAEGRHGLQHEGLQVRS